MGLKLKFACGEYDRTTPFRTGDVRPRDIDLEYTPQAPELTFLQQLRDRTFDVSEMSMSAYVQMRAAGKDDFIALPVFPSRIFRHSALYVRADSYICRPEQLRGRRVGIGYYQMSGAVWLRGILQDDYGVSPNEVQWISGMDLKAAPGADQIGQLDDMVKARGSRSPSSSSCWRAGRSTPWSRCKRRALWSATKRPCAICSSRYVGSKKTTSAAPASSR